MKIIHYAYEADVHCIGCTVARFKGVPPCALGVDENGVPYNATDNEGDKINVTLTTDETLDNYTPVCGTCGGKL